MGTATGLANTQVICARVRAIIPGDDCPTLADLFDAADKADVAASQLLTAPYAVPLPA